MKYYGIFLILLIVVIAVVIIISNKSKVSPPSKNTETTEVKVGETVTDAGTQAETSGKYKLRVNISANRISIYEWNSEISDYNRKPSKFMICSAESDISAGEYTCAQENTREIWHGCDDFYYRYYVEFSDSINFHSAAYEKKNDAGSMISDDYEKLNTGKSENGIMLLLADAKWIYENCSNESVVEVFEGDDEFSDEASYNKYIALPENIRWDPTDTSPDSPWCRTRIKSLTSPDVLTLKLNASEEFLMSFAKAVDEDDNDVSGYVYFTGIYDKCKPGIYAITYNLIDIYGNHLAKNVSVTIEEPETETESESELETESVTETINSNETISDSAQESTEVKNTDTTVEQQTDKNSGQSQSDISDTTIVDETSKLQTVSQEAVSEISESVPQ